MVGPFTKRFRSRAGSGRVCIPGMDNQLDSMKRTIQTGGGTEGIHPYRRAARVRGRGGVRRAGGPSAEKEFTGWLGG